MHIRKFFDASANLQMYHLMTQDTTHRVVSNDEGTKEIRTLSMLNVKHMESVGKQGGYDQSNKRLDIACWTIP